MKQKKSEGFLSAQKFKEFLTCPICKGEMKLMKDVIKEDNVEFNAYKCTKCGEELMDMKQLRNLTKEYRKLKDAQKIKFTQWGNSIAVRNSKSYLNDLGVHKGDTGLMYKEGNEIRIIPKVS